MSRCRAARYDALCLTIDTPVAGNRERDRVTGMTMPPRFTARSFTSFAARPRWASNLLLHPRFELSNVADRAAGIGRSLVSVIDYVNGQFDRSITWRDVEWLATLWDGPLIVKGIQSVTDAGRAVAAGATALMISNHGGRQLDGTLAPIDLIAAIRAAVGPTIELIVDGGVRRGSHVLKALALGANACSLGRPYLYGLAAGGRRGVEHVLGLLKAEIERDLILLGCAKARDIDATYLARLPWLPETDAIR
ncbi:MAG TPA: alpha-hydroxy acid oxidase [Steroidobacter sp.]